MPGTPSRVFYGNSASLWEAQNSMISYSIKDVKTKFVPDFSSATSIVSTDSYRVSCYHKIIYSAKFIIWKK